MLDELLHLPNGARFLRADLHNHTPKDRAFHCANMPVDTDEQKLAFAREYVRFARLEQGLDIIGITEHNDVSWLAFIQQAAEELNNELKEKGNVERLAVFPGVELSAMNSGKRSIHLLAIFEPGTKTEWLDSFISTLGLMPDDRFQRDGVPTAIGKTFTELCEAISEKKGLPIAAHVTGKNGLLADLQGAPRVVAYTYEKLWVVEIPGKRSELNDTILRIVNGQAHEYKEKRVACVNHSDGRGLNQVNQGRLQIGAKSTRIKLSNISVEGLRQAFIDYESRIRLEGEINDEHYPRLLGIILEGTFLSSQPSENIQQARTAFKLHLNPNLNTIIGGRGVGKSALVEILRYAFDIPAKSKDTQKQSDTLLSKTFPTGAKITVYYQLPDETVYRIERTRNHVPRVFNQETNEMVEGLSPKHILPGSNPIEVYGQKEVYEISTDEEAQLRLLDNYLSEALKPLREKERELIRHLEKNAEDILRLTQDVDEAEQKLVELPGIREELERLEKRDVVTQLAQKRSIDREKSLLEKFQGKVNTFKTDLKRFLSEHLPLAENELAQETYMEFPHAEILRRQAALVINVESLLKQKIEMLDEEIVSKWHEGEADRNLWQAEYEKVQEGYESLLREVQDASAERFARLNRQRDALEELQREVGKQRKRVKESKEERQRLLTELRKLRREQIHDLRQRKSQELTQRLGESLNVTVILEGQREPLEKYLTDIVSGTGITKSVVSQLVGSRTSNGAFLDAMDLASAIRHEKTFPDEKQSLLARDYQISDAYRKRLAALKDEVLFRLEVFCVEDFPDIRLKVGKEYRSLFPKPGAYGLSTGQKCTAILSLILVENDVPLIIDQPEDDLDNQFIFEEIVQTLRKEKERRQFLIATHNANIPVSGDAELIIVLGADEKNGWMTHAGSIDDPEIRIPVENILEGGREAFRIRKDKYGVSD